MSRELHAYSILPHRFLDKRTDNILAGLRAAGFQVEDLHKLRGRPSIGRQPGDPRDLLVTWTRHKGAIEAACKEFEAAGGRVLVCEEAHIRHPYPESEQHFCLSIHDHNGAGVNHPYHGRSRFRDWQGRGFVLKDPWMVAQQGRTRILVRQQRGIGSAAVACPSQRWHIETAKALQPLLPGYQVEPLIHPKNLKKAGKPVPTPADQFRDVAALVTWNSHTAAEALAEGVPIFHACRYSFWSGAGRFTPTLEIMAREIKHVLDTWKVMEVMAAWDLCREAMFQRYAWCQWSHSEIRRGDGTRWLIGS